MTAANISALPGNNQVAMGWDVMLTAGWIWSETPITGAGQWGPDLYRVCTSAQHQFSATWCRHAAAVVFQQTGSGALTEVLCVGCCLLGACRRALRQPAEHHVQHQRRGQRQRHGGCLGGRVGQPECTATCKHHLPAAGMEQPRHWRVHRGHALSASIVTHGSPLQATPGSPSRLLRIAFPSFALNLTTVSELNISRQAWQAITAAYLNGAMVLEVWARCRHLVVIIFLHG